MEVVQAAVTVATHFLAAVEEAGLGPVALGVTLAQAGQVEPVVDPTVLVAKAVDQVLARVEMAVAEVEVEEITMVELAVTF